MFLGADIDAYALSNQIGLAAAETVSMDKRHMRKAMQLQSMKASFYHGARVKGGAKAAAAQTDYSDEEKRDLGETPKE
jgi:hypothetical protein